jgi:hypothetical protein
MEGFARSCLMSVVHTKSTKPLTGYYTSSVQFYVWLNPQPQITLDILFTIRAQFTHGFVITCGHHALVATKHKLHSSKRFHRVFTQTYDVEYMLLTDVSHILVRTPNFTSDYTVYAMKSQSYYKISHSNTLKNSPILYVKVFSVYSSCQAFIKLEFRKDISIL